MRTELGWESKSMATKFDEKKDPMLRNLKVAAVMTVVGLFGDEESPVQAEMRSKWQIESRMNQNKWSDYRCWILVELSRSVVYKPSSTGSQAPVLLHYFA